MTLVAAWIRKNATLRELVVASDSRISGGESWDACPKIVPLPRPATVIAMSGEATAAYSFLLQAVNMCNLLDGNATGRTDIGYFANKLRDVFADSRSHVSDFANNSSRPDVLSLDVVLVGWSWRNLCFEGYSYVFSNAGQLVMNSLVELAEAKAYGVYLFGDGKTTARKRLKDLLRDRGLPVPMRGSPDARDIARNAFLNWEPLEVLLETIADPDMRTVGGVPQIVRIYQYGDVETFVWRSLDGLDFFGGRPVLPTERFDRRIIELVDGQAVISFSDRSIYGSDQGTSRDSLVRGRTATATSDSIS